MKLVYLNDLFYDLTMSNLFNNSLYCWPDWWKPCA